MTSKNFASFISAALSLAGFVAALATGDASAAAGTNRFSFTGPEIFPVAQQILALSAADFDGDGRMDLLVANNSRSKIALLYNQTGKTNLTRTPGPVASRDVNELPSDARFRIESIASEKRITSLTVADFNADGRPDIAYYGEPKELIVQLNNGTNGWSPPRRITLDDGQTTASALTHGDLNGDKLTDLLLLAESHVWFIAQKPGRTFAEPVKIPFTGSIKAAQVLDINGDGRDDLLLVNWDNTVPFRFRLQLGAGQLGPEIHFQHPPVRAYWADDLDADRRTEVITITQNSGRAAIANFVQNPAETLLGPLKLGQFAVTPLGKSDKSRRGVAWADVNGDSLTDLVAAEPDSGQLAISLQQADGNFAAPRRFPTFTGASDLAVSDWDGDGRPEIFLLSADERQAGVTRVEASGRVPFPKILPTDGKPLALAAGVLKSGARPVLAVVVDQDGRRVVQLHSADGARREQKLAEAFKSNPSALAIHDVNQDGLADLVVLTPYEKVKLLVQGAGGDFDETDATPPGGARDAEQPWFSAADVDGDGKPELLLAQKNFVRAVVLTREAKAAGADAKPSWAFTVKEQINGAAPNSRIIAATAMRAGANTVLFLLDAERKALTACERDASGVWQVTRNAPLPFTDFTTLAPISAGTTRPAGLGFLGLNAVASLALHGTVWELKELDGYESPIKDGRLADIVTGDLNQDGRKDLVFLETAKHHVDMVTFDAPHKLTPGNRWQVFEERTFRSRGTDGREPREALIVDVTGDKKNDLVLLVHDRILVYPQD